MPRTTSIAGTTHLRWRRIRILLATLALQAASLGALAGDLPEAVQGGKALVRVTLTDGSVLVGHIQAEDEAQIEIVSPAGATARVPRASIVSIEPREGQPAAAAEAPEPSGTGASARARQFTRNDPNRTRLLFAPTGRPLGKGEGQFADYMVLFPGFAYGLTDNLSLMGGVSVIPGVGPGEQLLYVAPRLGFQPSPRVAFSTGVLYATAGEAADRAGAGIAFAVGTFGERHASVSVGLGYGFLADEGEFERADNPIIMLGGEIQLRDNLALISENWLIPDLKASEQPFGLALRFFGERLSVDAGVILVGEVLKEGFPIPWLSFSYRLGHAKPSGRARATLGPPPLPPRLR